MTPLYPQKLALTSPTGGGRSVGIVRSRTKATEFSLVLVDEVSVLASNSVSLCISYQRLCGNIVVLSSKVKMSKKNTLSQNIGTKYLMVQHFI